MKLYLETTVPSFLFADDAPEKQEVTRQFFKWLAISPDKLYISELVLAELNRASPDVRNKLLEAVVRLPVENLSITDEAVDVALAVLNNLDVVVTWNMKHLANVRRIEGINRTNASLRLPLIRIHTPEEVIDL